MFKINCGLLAAVLTVCLVSEANATLVGDVVACAASSAPNSPFLPLNCSPTEAEVVEAITGAEFAVQENMALNLVNVDPDGASVRISSAFPAPFPFAPGDTIRLSDLDWADEPLAVLVGIANFTSVGVLNAGIANVTFGPDSITIDLSDMVFQTDGFLQFDLVTGTIAIPLPPAALLMLGALAGIGLAGRRSAA